MANLRESDLGTLNGKQEKRWRACPDLFPCIYLCRTLANWGSPQEISREKEISRDSRKFDTQLFIVTGIPRVNPATVA
jgi:hypothetical protein